jgi:hypothetical protein
MVNRGKGDLPWDKSPRKLLRPDLVQAVLKQQDIRHRDAVTIRKFVHTYAVVSTGSFHPRTIASFHIRYQMMDLHLTPKIPMGLKAGMKSSSVRANVNNFQRGFASSHHLGDQPDHGNFGYSSPSTDEQMAVPFRALIYKNNALLK